MDGDHAMGDVVPEGADIQGPVPLQQQRLPVGQPPLPDQPTPEQMVVQLRRELAAVRLQEDHQALFLKTSSCCKFACFDGEDMDKLSLDMFYGNVDMHVLGLPDVVQVGILTSKLQGQPRETIDQKLKMEPAACTYEGCKEALRRMYQARDPVAKSEALLRAGFEHGKCTVVEYVQDILPHLRRCRSSTPDKVGHMLAGLGLKDEGFRMGVSTCQSTSDYEWSDIEKLSAHIMVTAKRMDSVTGGPAGFGSSQGGSANGHGKGGKGRAGLGAQGGIQKPKPSHAPSLALKDRIPGTACMCSCMHNKKVIQSCTCQPSQTLQKEVEQVVMVAQS